LKESSGNLYSLPQSRGWGWRYILGSISESADFWVLSLVFRLPISLYTFHGCVYCIYGLSASPLVMIWIWSVPKKCHMLKACLVPSWWHYWEVIGSWGC
jgi:hypothetical protein